MKEKLPLIGGLLLGAAFLFFGFTKVTGQEEAVQMFQAWGFPVWFVYVTGVMEMTGGVLAAIPRTRFFGAGLVSLVLLGAVGSHIKNADFGGMFPAAIVFLLIAAAVAWASRPGAASVSLAAPQRQ